VTLAPLVPTTELVNNCLCLHPTCLQVCHRSCSLPRVLLLCWAAAAMSSCTQPSQAFPCHMATHILKHCSHLFNRMLSAGVSQEFSLCAGAVAVLGSSGFEQLQLTLTGRPCCVVTSFRYHLTCLHVCMPAGVSREISFSAGAVAVLGSSGFELLWSHGCATNAINLTAKHCLCPYPYPAACRCVSGVFVLCWRCGGAGQQCL
jgi:hypothetical protein